MGSLLYCSAYIHFSKAISSVVKMINIQEYMRCNFFDLKGTGIDHIYIFVCLLYVCIFQMHIKHCKKNSFQMNEIFFVDIF